MMEKLKTTIKGIGIAMVYLIALLITYFLVWYISLGLTVCLISRLLWLLFNAIGAFFMILAIITIPIAFSFVKKKWAKPLRFINILNIILIICIFVFAQPYTTATEMETNYLEHKEDMEKLIRYVNASAKPNTELKYKLKDIESSDDKIKSLMEKANVKEIKLLTQPDTCTIKAILVYKYFGDSKYAYTIKINEESGAPRTYPKFQLCLHYNDSVAFRGISKFLSVNEPSFPDYAEFKRKLKNAENND